jgi:hypothetical protein
MIKLGVVNRTQWQAESQKIHVRIQRICEPSKIQILYLNVVKILDIFETLAFYIILALASSQFSLGVTPSSLDTF